MKIGLVIGLICVFAFPADAQMTSSIDGAGTQAAPYMTASGPAEPPDGFVRFCEMTPEECDAGQSGFARVVGEERFQELEYVTWHVNRKIQPATDLEMYGQSELWTVPRTRGDCEDYALLKRKILLARGWPRSSLLMTVVRDEKGEGHAVLTARTAQGDFVLDNKDDEVRLWSRTGYRFVMRQSTANPHIWVSLGRDDALAASSHQKP